MAQTCSFVRNIIVARGIGAENFGIAATFAVTISIMDMLSSVSADRLLVQATDGNQPTFQSAAHTVQASRGMLSAAMLVALAWPISHLFSIPQAAWAFAYLALVPLLRGIAHLDPQRVQRDMNFRPTAIIEVVQQIIPTLLAWPIVNATHSYSALLWLLIIQAATGTALSFLIAERPYRWNFDRAYMRRFISFGWPLIINSILLFTIYQGDRFLLASAHKTFGITTYTLADLGAYSVAVSLTLTPMVAISTISSSIMLPVFSRTREAPSATTKRYIAFVEILTIISALFALPLIICGGFIVTNIYGSTYTAAISVIGWLGAAQAIRITRFAPGAVAMSHADTKNSMYANMARSAAIFAVFAVLLTKLAMTWIGIAAFVGELCGLLVSLIRLQRRQQVPIALTMRPVGMLVIAMATAAVINRMSPSGPVLKFAALGSLIFGYLTCMFLTSPNLRRLLLELFSRRLRSGDLPNSREALPTKV